MRYVLLGAVLLCAGCVPIPQFDTTLRVESEPVPIDIRITYGDVVNSVTRECTTPCEVTLRPGTAIRIEPLNEGWVDAGTPPAPAWEHNILTGQFYLSPNPVRYVLRPEEEGEQ